VVLRIGRRGAGEDDESGDTQATHVANSFTKAGKRAGGMANGLE